MKIRLEKPAVNISKLTGGKNEKARRGALHEKLRLDLFCLQETLNGNQNNWICDISTRSFLIEILLHKYNVDQTEVIFVHFYYSQIMRTFKVFTVS